MRFPYRLALPKTVGVHAARRRLDVGLITACDLYDRFDTPRLAEDTEVTCYPCRSALAGPQLTSEEPTP